MRIIPRLPVKAGVVDSALTAEKSNHKYTPAIALIALGQIIVATDFCVTSVALPSIGRAFAMGPNLLPWVVTVFSLFYAGALILCGRLADLLGHRRVCLFGLLFFGIGSLGTAAAPTIPLLIASRAIEGLGAACLTPTSFSLINVLLPAGSARHLAFSVFGVTQGLSYILSLYGGGLLVATFGWRSAFLLNLPALVAATALAWRVIPRRSDASTRFQVDVLGAFLITSGMGVLLFALSATNKSGWMSVTGLGALAGACALLVSLWFLEARHSAPLIPPSLFRHDSVVGADVGTVLMVAAAASVFVLLSLYMQRVLHFSAVSAGLGMVPQSLAVMAGGQLVGRTMSHIPPRQSILVGVLFFLLGTLFVCVAPQHWGYTEALLPAMIAIGIGSTVANLTLMAMSTAAVPRDDQNLASAVLMTSQQIGVSLGIAISFAVIANGSVSDASSSFRLAFLSAAALAALSLVPSLLLTRNLAGERREEPATAAQ